MQPHVAQAHRRIGRGQQQVERRPVDPPVQHHLDRAIAALPPAADKVEGPVAPPDRLAGQADVGAGQHQAAEMEDAVGPALQIGGQVRQAARQRMEKGVVEPPDLRLAAPDDTRAMAVRTRHGGQPRLHIDDAEAGDEVTLERAVQPDVIAPVGQVDAQVQPSRQLVGAQRQSLPHDLARGDAQVARRRQPVKDSPRRFPHAGHARRGEAHRQGQGPAALQSALARRHGLLEPGLVEREAGRRHPIVECRPLERPVEPQRHGDRLSAHVAEQRLGPDEPGVDAHPLEPVRAQIDHPPRLHTQCGRSQHQRAVQLAVGKIGLSGDDDARRGQPLEPSMQHQRRRDLSRQGIAPRLGRQAKIDRALSADPAFRHAVPARPASRPGDVERDGRADAHGLCQHAVLRPPGLDRQVETVVIGPRVEMQAQPVAARHHAVQHHDRTTVANVRRPLDLRHPLTAQHAWREDQPVEP